MRRKLEVTVGLCVKNNEKTIHQAIKSILDQDFPHKLMEIIVVDGESKDKTLEIIKNCISNSNIPTRIYSDEGSGLGLARQIVVENAEGEYIAWIDGDIVIPKSYIKTQVDFLVRCPKAGAVQGNRWNYKGKSMVATLEIMSNLHYILENQRNKLATRGAVYRVKAVKDVGGFDKSIRGAGEDIDLSVRMRRRGWLLYMNEGEWTHIARENWKGLFDQYKWYGYGLHFIGHKHKGLVVLWQWLPLVSLLGGYRRSLLVYKITRKKISFLLPLLFLYRGLAWLSGYLKSHRDGYGHKSFEHN